MMNYSQQCDAMELLAQCLSIADIKHSRLGLMESAIILQADFGPHCADQNCTERLTLALWIGSDWSRFTASPHSSLSGLITGLIERLKLSNWENEGEASLNSLNLSLTASAESGLSTEENGLMFPESIPRNGGEDG